MTPGLQEFSKKSLSMTENARCKPQKIHRYHVISMQFMLLIIELTDNCAVFCAIDRCMFHYSLQKTLTVKSANASGYRTMLLKRIVELVTAHGKLHIVGPLATFQKTSHQRVGFRAIKIIGIDYGKRTCNSIFSHQHGMSRTSGFDALRGIRYSGRNIVNLLKNKRYVNMLLKLRYHLTFKIVSKAFPDHKHHPAKASPNGILN
jgi:hypothetical protein